jgi:hypothetical protein
MLAAGNSPTEPAMIPPNDKLAICFAQVAYQLHPSQHLESENPVRGNPLLSTQLPIIMLYRPKTLSRVLTALSGPGCSSASAAAR